MWSSPILPTLLCLLLTFLAVAGQKKLPVYVGVSYDLLYGNPLSDHVDPGFLHPIFKWTYDDNIVIDKGRYLIPDQVGYNLMSVCSFESQFSNYTGGQSYQKALNAKIAVGAGYKGRVNEASFTFSDNFQKMEKSTLDESRTVTQSTAECQAYRLTYNPFDSSDMTPNFKNGVILSYRNKDWDKLVSQYGTSYVSEVTMGGRATQEIIYDSKSLSQMITAGTNLEAAAKASFKKFYATGDYNSTSNKEASSYAESYSNSIRQFNVGGQPLRDGNSSNWWLKVLENPMPINIKLDWISELFKYINASNFNASQAKGQFNNYLDNYCDSLGCQAARADKGLPSKAIIQKVTSKFTHGGVGTTDPSKITPWTKQNRPLYLVSVNASYSPPSNNSNITQFKSLRFLFSDGAQNFTSSLIGEQKGTASLTWNVPRGDYVTQVESLSWGGKLAGIIFRTNTGKRSPAEWSSSPQRFSLETFPEGFGMIGFQSKKDATTVEWIRFILAKVTYESGEQTRGEIIRSRSIQVDA